jgi:hypothetical protein
MIMNEPISHPSGDIITISTSQGETKRIKLNKFAAMDGWEIKRQTREYTESTDPKFRNYFTLIVLSYAAILGEGDSFIMLANSDIVNESLESWMNVEIVFDAVLAYNNIDHAFKEERNKQWKFAGEEMAASFLAATSYMMKPAIESFSKGQVNGV